MKRKHKTITIDGTDKKILRKLMEDARTPILEIGRLVGISGAAIHQRLKKLEKSGLISASRCIINPKILGTSNNCSLDDFANTFDFITYLFVI